MGERSDAPVDPALRVGSWNVMHSLEGVSPGLRAGRVRQVLVGRGVELALLQEAWEGLGEALASSLPVKLAAAHYTNKGSGCVVLVPERARVLSSAQLTFPLGDSPALYGAAAALFELDGVRVAALSAHLPWGARAECARLDAACMIDEQLDGLGGDVALFGADMNAVPQAECHRFLKGLAPWRGRTAFYVDVAEALGVEAPTQDPSLLPLVEQSARTVGVDRPDLLPARRLDVVMCRGWAHGRPLSPLAASVDMAAAADVSDHAPVVADLLWTPPALAGESEPVSIL